MRSLLPEVRVTVLPHEVARACAGPALRRAHARGVERDFVPFNQDVNAAIDERTSCDK